VTIRIITLLLLSTIATFAQDLSQLSVSGKAELLSGELLDKSVRDANGQGCAGVAIVSDLEGLKYESNNGIVKMSGQPGRDLLFVSADERVITVYKTGFAPLKLFLNEIGIKLKPGGVWQVKVTGEKKSDTIPVNFLKLPPDAVIFVDGVSKGTLRNIQLPAGKHALRIEKEGYKTIVQTMDVSASNNLFDQPMESVDAIAVYISSVPRGAKIVVNETEKGETDKGLWLMPGRYKVRVQLSGYLSSEKEIDVTEGRDNKASFTLSKNSGMLLLEVIPSDAKVLINKEDYSGRSDIELAPGSYKIEVARQNYVGAAEVAVVELGKTTRKSFTLVARTGDLQVSVQPPGASVQLLRDGKVVQEWQGLKIVKGLIIGAYTLKATASGYKPFAKDIVVEEGKTLPVDCVLTKGPGTSFL
jgi:hypothetical protein